MIDYKLIRSNPKILIGYSDITALHLAIHRHTGLVTFHGPVASSTFSDYTVTHLQAVLMQPQEQYTIPMALENHRRAQTHPNFTIRTVHGGQATGRLTGGNLCMVSALAGTPYAAEFDAAHPVSGRNQRSAIPGRPHAVPARPGRWLGERQRR